MKNWIRLCRDPGDAGAAAGAAPAAGAAATPAAGAAAPAVTAPGSASTTVNLNNPPAPAPAAFTIPVEYKDKPYLKGIDSPEKLFKMLDGAQALIGQPKGVIKPADTAPQVEKDAYYEALGRPKIAGDYKFDGEDKTNPQVLEKLKGMFFKHGVPADVAKGQWADFQAIIGESAKADIDARAAADTAFAKLATDAFGANRDKMLETANALIKTHGSPATTAILDKLPLDKLPNEALVVLADVLNNISKKYIKPDGAPPGGPTATGGTPDELRAKARLLMEKQGKVSPMSEEFNSLQKEIDGIYDTIRQSGRR
jgi:hypothetical protein